MRNTGETAFQILHRAELEGARGLKGNVGVFHMVFLVHLGSIFLNIYLMYYVIMIYHLYHVFQFHWVSFSCTLLTSDFKQPALAWEESTAGRLGRWFQRNLQASTVASAAASSPQLTVSLLVFFLVTGWVGPGGTDIAFICGFGFQKDARMEWTENLHLISFIFSFHAWLDKCLGLWVLHQIMPQLPQMRSFEGNDFWSYD